MSDIKKLYLLDAMALIFRAYFAMGKKPLITSYGKNTNAQYGFTSTLLELLRKQKPTHIAVAFDTHAPTHRHIDFTDYKATREKTPEDIIEAVSDIKEILKGFKISCIELDGYEADDIIGTIALQMGQKDFQIYMVTPDKDYGQLVRDNIFIYRPSFMGYPAEIYGQEKICQKWDIQNVDQVIDMLGLMGDVSDNIPGIHGVGEKTACKLLKTYHTLENVLENADHIQGSIGEKIRQGKEQAIMSKKLATIVTDVPLVYSEQNFAIQEQDSNALQSIFAKLELRTLAKRVLNSEAPTLNDNANNPSLFTTPDNNPLPHDFKTIHTVTHNYQTIDTKEKINDLIKQLSTQKEIAVDTETTSLKPLEAQLVGISFAYQKGEAFYIPIHHDTHALEVVAQLKPLFDNTDITWIGQNIKYDILVLRKYDVFLKGTIYDTMIAQYLIDAESKKNMDLLSMNYLNYQPVSIETLIGAKGPKQGNMRDVPVSQISDYACEDADVTFQLKQVLQPLIEQHNHTNLLYQVELPLITVLADMESEGVRIDIDFLGQYNQQLYQEIKLEETAIYEIAGTKFNIDSPKQLGNILFDTLDLKSKLDFKLKPTKLGAYPTGEDVLHKLKPLAPTMIDHIFNYRELSKLRSTYTDALSKMVDVTQKIHTSFQQFITVTGRLSSADPNLQNIPIRTPRGREIRKAFIPSSENYILVSADYSQIELRIIAAISGDEAMCRAFLEGKDVHRATAARIYNIPESEVDSTMRRKAKSVNFGIIYGQTAFGLSENIGISRQEAKELIDMYFQKYPAIQQYMTNQIAYAKQYGYVETLMGRRRYLKDIYSTNSVVRGYAERNAINMPIQGTAADMIKIAMIKIHHAIKNYNLKSRLILQVHDELVVDTLRSEEQAIKDILIENMQNAMQLPYNLPVQVEVGTGMNWAEAH